MSYINSMQQSGKEILDTLTILLSDNYQLYNPTGIFLTLLNKMIKKFLMID
jgi:hypothetical protein